MKAILEFNLPEEQEEFNAASHALRLQSACFSVLRMVHDACKYQEISEETRKALEAIADAVHEDVGDLLEF